MTGSDEELFGSPQLPIPGETGAGADDRVRVRADEGFVRPPNPQSWGRQDQGQMTGSGSGQMRDSFGPLNPNPGGVRDRDRVRCHGQMRNSFGHPTPNPWGDRDRYRVRCHGQMRDSFGPPTPNPGGDVSVDWIRGL